MRNSNALKIEGRSLVQLQPFRLETGDEQDHERINPGIEQKCTGIDQGDLRTHKGVRQRYYIAYGNGDDVDPDLGLYIGLETDPVRQDAVEEGALPAVTELPVADHKGTCNHNAHEDEDEGGVLKVGALVKDEPVKEKQHRKQGYRFRSLVPQYQLHLEHDQLPNLTETAQEGEIHKCALRPDFGLHNVELQVHLQDYEIELIQGKQDGKTHHNRGRIRDEKAEQVRGDLTQPENIIHIERQEQREKNGEHTRSKRMVRQVPFNIGDEVVICQDDAQDAGQPGGGFYGSAHHLVGEGHKNKQRQDVEQLENRFKQQKVDDRCPPDRKVKIRLNGEHRDFLQKEAREKIESEVVEKQPVEGRNRIGVREDLLHNPVDEKSCHQQVHNHVECKYPHQDIDNEVLLKYRRPYRLF